MAPAPKTAVVTGAASGIGQATAEALAASGFHVVCADIATDGAENTAARINRNDAQARAVQCDVSDPSDVDSMIESAIDWDMKNQPMTTPTQLMTNRRRPKWYAPPESATMSLASIAVAYIERPTIHHGRLRLARNQSPLLLVPRPRMSAKTMMEPFSRTTISQSIGCI